MVIYCCVSCIKSQHNHKLFLNAVSVLAPGRAGMLYICNSLSFLFLLWPKFTQTLLMQKGRRCQGPEHCHWGNFECPRIPCLSSSYSKRVSFEFLPYLQGLCRCLTTQECTRRHQILVLRCLGLFAYFQLCCLFQVETLETRVCH